MKAVQRTDSKGEAAWVIVKFAYYYLALPFLVVMVPVTLIGNFGHTMSKPDAAFYAFSVAVWAALLIPLGVKRFSKWSRRRQLNQIVASLSNAERFSPQTQHQIMDAGRGKYLGIDTQRGTILYIHIVKTRVIDVIGLDMKGWTNRELDGGVLRLYTRMPDVPVLSINAHPTVAKALFDTLGAMSHNSYIEPFPNETWADYVRQQSRFVAFEHNAVVPQTA